VYFFVELREERCPAEKSCYEEQNDEKDKQEDPLNIVVIE